MSPEQKLAGAEWLQRPETQAIFAALDGDKGRTRAVGGVVRDTLLSREAGQSRYRSGDRAYARRSDRAGQGQWHCPLSHRN
ncbi:hypothetical protein N8D56_10930 [Devosia sp. A8/3-2]|nr:hypothetical protein N8D56_10930 [Devosia sp. A8/3-2]